MGQIRHLKNTRIDVEHSLDQLTGRFQSIKDGVPELLKNAKDQYSRKNIDSREHRHIVLVFGTTTRSIAVIDFAGASRDDFEAWITWSDRKAHRAEFGQDIEGGHGNGGKAFMVRGTTVAAYLESCSNGMFTKMGFDTSILGDLKYRPGYAVEDDIELNSIGEGDPAQRIAQVLTQCGAQLNDLPPAVREEFEAGRNYTAVSLIGVKDWSERSPTKIARTVEGTIAAITNHSQSAITLDTCSVWAIVDGKLTRSSPLSVPTLEPMDEIKEPIRLQVPEFLQDTETGEEVVTGATAECHLTLNTSRKNLRMTTDLSSRNIIRVWNRRNVVAMYQPQDLGRYIQAKAHIWGVLKLDKLEGDHLADSHRTRLAETPLTRALLEWAGKHIDELALRIHEIQAVETRPEERAKAQSVLRSFRDLMRQYLEVDPFRGDDELEGEDAGKGDGEEGRKKARKGSAYGSGLTRIELERGDVKIYGASGTRVPYSYRCIGEAEDGSSTPVRNAEVDLVSSAPGVVASDGNGSYLFGEPGVASVYLKSPSIGVESNRIDVEVLRCKSVEIVVPARPLLQGQRAKLDLIFSTTKGRCNYLLIEGNVLEPGLAWLGRRGVVTAGHKESAPTICVKYGPGSDDVSVANIAIGADKAPSKGTGGDSTGNIPTILLCGEEAPGYDEYPPESRTHPGGAEYPTIIEEPPFMNVVWINPHSEESRRVRERSGGPKGISGIATGGFSQYLALKCFDILKRLRVRQELKGSAVTETEFVRALAVAETECSGFVSAAFDISAELLSGAKL